MSVKGEKTMLNISTLNMKVVCHTGHKTQLGRHFFTIQEASTVLEFNKKTFNKKHHEIRTR